jgi:hypothetical protein
VNKECKELPPTFVGGLLTSVFTTRVAAAQDLPPPEIPATSMSRSVRHVAVAGSTPTTSLDGRSLDFHRLS